MNKYFKKIICSNRIYDLVIQSPLEYAPILSNKYNNNLYFKREEQQPVKSFKLRGAYNMMLSLDKNQLNNGVITASAGNHAQGVALSAKHLGSKAIIVMPIVTPSIKVDAVKMYGAEILLYGDNFDEANKKAQEISKEKNLTFIHPFDHIDVIAGQGTISSEICKQWTNKNNIDYIFVPVGGGGLIAGIGLYIKELYPNIKIIGVEPEEACALKVSLDNKKKVRLNEIGTFADGVAVKEVGDLTFDICKDVVDDMVLCNTDNICQSIHDIFNENRVIMEPAGALAVAGAKKYIIENNLVNNNIICINSGANINFTTLKYISERSIVSEILLGVSIPEIPGSLRTFCSIIENRNITEFNYRFSNNKIAHIFVGIDTGEMIDTNKNHIKSDIVTNLRNSFFSVTDLSENELAKTHIRYKIGGNVDIDNEVLYRFEFPEKKGALIKFLDTMSEISNDKWNITIFHYRSDGSSIGKVLCGLSVPVKDETKFSIFLNQLGYKYICECNNHSYNIFL